MIYTNGRKFLNGIYNSKDLWDKELLPLLNKNTIDYVLYVDADEFLYIGKFMLIFVLLNENIRRYIFFLSIEII